MLGLDISQTNRVLVGAFIGMFIVSLTIPIYIVFGITPSTAIILFYLIPLTGAIVAFILSDSNSETHNSSHRTDKYKQFLGHFVKVQSKEKTYRGRLNRSGENMILISNVIDENNIQKDHIFLDKAEVNEIKKC